MSERVFNISHGLRRMAVEAKVALSVRKANMAVTRAFQTRRWYPLEMAVFFSGAAIVSVFVYILASHAYTSAAVTAHMVDTGAGKALVTAMPAVAPPVIEQKTMPGPTAPPAGSSVVIPEKTMELTNPAELISPIGLTSPTMLIIPVDKPAPLTSGTALAMVNPQRLPDTAPILNYHFPQSQSLYTIAVDKTRRTLFVLEETKDNYRIVKRYSASLGSKRGDKLARGDDRTPEGLYYIVKTKKGSELPPRYGPRAFVLDYPNEVDIREGKTGSGIWIHGSGMGERTAATEGCVEINDTNVFQLEKYAEKGTPVYIFPEGFRLPIRNGAIQKDVIKPEVLYSLKKNMQASAEKS